jgi:hypothetical protein
MSNEFKNYIEKHRVDILNLTAKQDKELARLYLEAAGNIKERAELIINKKGLTYAQAKIRINSLLREAARLSDNFKGILDKALIDAADLGKEVNKIAMSMYQKSLASEGYKLGLTRILSKTSKEAVKYTFNKIWSDGLKLSDRVWLLDKRTKQEIERIVMSNIISGGSASDRMTLSALENLLNPKYTPARLTSLHGRKVSYEASRLLRTEMMISFNEADRLSSNLNPGSKGQVWLAASGCCDICDSNDGKPTNEVGIPPAHPNCRCTTTEDIISIDKFTNDWIKFQRSPNSVPYLNKWYKEIYKVA